MEPPLPLHRSGDATMLEVWVVPGASKTEITGLHDGALRVRVAAPAAAGKANRSLERFLAELLGERAVIVRGSSARRKQVRIENPDLAALAALLGLGST